MGIPNELHMGILMVGLNSKLEVQNTSDLRPRLSDQKISLFYWNRLRSLKLAYFYYIVNPVDAIGLKICQETCKTQTENNALKHIDTFSKKILNDGFVYFAE